MNKFDKLIQEALSFNQTFKAPDAEEKKLRRVELFKSFIENSNVTKLPDGSLYLNDDLDFSQHYIQSLIGLNISVINGYFSCSHNQLTTLEGGPIEVKESFFCDGNFLRTLVGCPKKVGGDFYCHYNDANFTEEYVRSLCEVAGEVNV